MIDAVWWRRLIIDDWLLVTGIWWFKIGDGWCPIGDLWLITDDWWGVMDNGWRMLAVGWWMMDVGQCLIFDGWYMSADGWWMKQAGAGWRSAVPVKLGGIARSSNLKYFNNYLSAYLEHNNGRKERSEYSKYSSRKLLQNSQINCLYMMGHYIRLQKWNFF